MESLFETSCLGENSGWMYKIFRTPKGEETYFYQLFVGTNIHQITFFTRAGERIDAYVTGIYERNSVPIISIYDEFTDEEQEYYFYHFLRTGEKKQYLPVTPRVLVAH